ncbi:hypothetical protein ACKKBF_B11790 [Auxenochlorella protothecoides x Auxenochlorella symbiontica]
MLLAQSLVLVLVLGHVARGETCRTRGAAVGVPQALLDGIDETTPLDACTKSVCAATRWGACSGKATAMSLVMSDEFGNPKKSLAVGVRDRKWTAEKLHYSATQDIEVYQPEQVQVRGGALELKMSKRSSTAVTQGVDGSMKEVSSKYASGMVTSWNKFCFTGGYIEVSAQLPGDDVTPGFWPAIWMMGNLARPGYLATAEGMWPYSYSTCDDAARKVAWSTLPGQRFSACMDRPGQDRGRFGWEQGRGRGAPEVDLIEVGLGYRKVDKKGRAKGAGSPPTASHSLQMAPLQPPGTPFMERGVAYPGSQTHHKTTKNDWKGVHGRPGNLWQDCFSAKSLLNGTFYAQFHKFGLFWQPGEVMRWTIDDQVVFEVNADALVEVTNATGAYAGPRSIPNEAMFLVMNFGMSYSFSSVDLAHLAFPSIMKIDHVRLYQLTDKINVGCSPRRYPTSQYLACNKERFVPLKEDKIRIPDRCLSTTRSYLPALVWIAALAAYLYYKS